MGQIRQRVVQGGADTYASLQLPLVALDGKSGYEILAIEAYWVSGPGAAAADYSLNAKIATSATTFSFQDDEIIAQLDWGMQNTGGVAVAVGFEPQKSKILIEPRVTVQPQIFVIVQSSATGQANTVDFRVYYNTIKMTELEYLRMYTGGA